MWRKAGARRDVSGVVFPSEARLISSVAAGDRHAFELLYRTYFPKLTRFLHRVTRQPELLEEIVNDTMLVVWQKANTFDDTCKLSTWIFAIAYRTALKALRGRDDPLPYDFDAEPDDDVCEPDRQAERHELQAALQRALDALSFEQRAVVCLTYFHGLGYEEIGTILDCPVNTVKTRMFHARRRLESLLTRSMEEL